MDLPSILLVCSRCKGALDARGEDFLCANCAVAFPREGGIVDFAEGKYYDDFPGPEVLSSENLRGLANESEGARIEDYYGPLLDRIATERGVSRAGLSVLDSGCGNGESVDVLSRLGFEAWGHDLSALRKWQWREREHRDRLVVAGGETLPFPDGAFDAVIASGVLEHVGVSEEGGGRYRVSPMSDRDARRRRYLAELLRVLAPRGRLFLDFPNGAFPIDFWHGVKPGGARFHWPGEGFLPTVTQVRALCAGLGDGLRVTALSPEGRLRFRQVSAHWYGRALRAPMAGLYRLMSTGTFRFLAASPLNPYLVIEVRCGASRRRPEELQSESLGDELGADRQALRKRGKSGTLPSGPTLRIARKETNTMKTSGCAALVGTLLLAALPAVAGDAAAVAVPEWGTKSTILKNVHAYAFVPSFSTQGVGVFQNGRYATTGAGAKEFIAPLDLPAGALVNAIAVLACEDGTGSVFTSLDRISLGDIATVNSMESITTISGQGCQFPGFNPDPAFTIDNHNNLYQLRVVINGPAGNGLRFYEVLVGYQLQISPAPASPTFGDVPTSHTYFRAIEAFAASGVTGGCGNGNYCPNQFVTRGEMAAFFARALGLHFPF